MQHLLLVGRPGAGKTTVMKRLAAALKGRPIDGFLTEELREAGERLGFWLSSLDGRQALLAHKQLEGGYRVGPYKVNVDVLEAMAVPIIQRGVGAASVLFLDELGKMELCSAAFQQAVHEAFDRGPTVVASVGVAHVPFLASLKQRRDVELIPLTVSNREAVQEELVERLGMLCLEDEPARALERQADRICQMIVAGDAPQLDIEIQQAALRDAVSRRFPEKPALYPLAYETRFRRVWQQFRHQGHG